jgi:hypothetical protein
MAAQEKLNLAIVTKLRADTGAGSLVALTNHDPTGSPPDFRIGRLQPLVAGKGEYLGVRVAQSKPLMGEDVTSMQLAMVDFYCMARVELTSIKIADRMESLLHDEIGNPSTPNTGYYDFSDTEISTRSTRFVNRLSAELDDEDTDVWTTMIRAEVVWVGNPCP